MKIEQILEKADLAAKDFTEGDFYIGCKVDELLPNKNKSTLVCVDCSWLRDQQAIVDRNDLDEIENGEKTPEISIRVEKDFSEIIFTKWVDMIDNDGDIHHCKIESFMETTDNIYRPFEADDIDWVVYIEL
jgi:hypothetical protein